MQQIFARHEKTADEDILKFAHAADLKREAWHDIHLYYDQKCRRPAGIIPVGFNESRPTRRNKYQVLNGITYRLIWTTKPGVE